MARRTQQRKHGDALCVLLSQSSPLSASKKGQCGCSESNTRIPCGPPNMTQSPAGRDGCMATGRRLWRNRMVRTKKTMSCHSGAESIATSLGDGNMKARMRSSHSSRNKRKSTQGQPSEKLARQEERNGPAQQIHVCPDRIWSAGRQVQLWVAWFANHHPSGSHLCKRCELKT